MNAIPTIMQQILTWLQSVILSFVDAIALFLPPLYQLPVSPGKPAPPGIGVTLPDPLYTQYFLPNGGTSLASLDKLLFGFAVAFLTLRVTAEAFRLYFARDAGEQIMPPLALVRRVVVAVMFLSLSGWTVTYLSLATNGTVQGIREQLYATFNPGKGATPFLYPDIRNWVRDMGCLLMVPNNVPGGLVVPPEFPHDGIRCVGAVAGGTEATLHWTPPDPWYTFTESVDTISTYNDLRDYEIWRRVGVDPSWVNIQIEHGDTSYTDKGLQVDQTYHYMVTTWSHTGGHEVSSADIEVKTNNGQFRDSQRLSARAFFNIILALSLTAGVIVIVAQTAVRTVELIFAKMLGPIMALSALGTDDFLSQGSLAMWLREVVVLILSQLTQLVILCALVSLVPVTRVPIFRDVMFATILIGIGTQGPRVLRQYAWSGDNGKLASVGGQVVSRWAGKLPW